MKTIVINTSKEASRTRLDVLFKAPFDQSALLWYDTALSAMDGAAAEIKKALITDTDTVDRDYNLIVLVDLYAFPRGNEKEAAQLYRTLLVRYIRKVLVEKLHVSFNLLPMGVSIYFADSAVKEAELDIESLEENPLEQQRLAREAALLAEKQLPEGSGDLCDEELPAPAPRPAEERDAQARLIMNLFSWTEETDRDSLGWTLKASITDDTVLDFSEIFHTTSLSIRHSSASVDALGLALRGVKEELAEPADSLPGITSRDFSIRVLTCSFKRDNEQSLTEGWFNLFANVFSCIQSGKLQDSPEKYDPERIRELLVNALRKYRWFAKDENIRVDFEPIARIFDIRGQICKKRMETAQSTNKYKDKTPKEVADIIMKQDAPKADAASVAGGQKLRGMDLAFYTTVAEIFGNYDPEVIRRQNNDIVKNCLKGLWNWRDKQTGENFRLAVDAALAEDRQKGQKSDGTDDARADIAFIKEEYEREYTELINEVTEAEHKLAANQNILIETKDLILKYGDLMRKGRLYLLSFIGAVLAIVAAVLPFIYIQVNFSGENLLHKILYLVFTAGFAALYAVACLIYSRKLTKKKRLLTEELEKLKEKSESERRESIAALYTYYSHTVVETESHCLLWREILRRDRENAKKGIKRNNHKKRLERLAGLVERFMTMMKLGDADAVTDAPYDPRDLCLTAEESFHSPDNQRVYGILSEQEDAHKNGIEEGGEA